MRTALARRRLRLLPIVLALAGAGDAQSALAATPKKQVLVLYSVRRDAQIARIGDRELPRILGENLAEGVDLYSEYLDIPRFQDPEYRTAFRDFLLLKYKGHRAASLLLAQSGLIGLLLVQARRRRQAEEQVRGSQKKLLASHEQIRDLGGRLLRARTRKSCICSVWWPRWQSTRLGRENSRCMLSRISEDRSTSGAAPARELDWKLRCLMSGC
jgi:hypothetical protein